MKTTWNHVASKPAPKKKHSVLCWWSPVMKGSKGRVDILIHWPDGEWSDTSEGEVDMTDDLEAPFLWSELPELPQANGWD